MRFLENRTDERMDSLEVQAESLSRQIKAKDADIERDQELAAAHDSEGWASVVKILKAEMVRLAQVRMNVPFDDNEAHVLITGQYKEAEILSGRAEEVENRLASGLRERAKLEEKLAAVNNKIITLRSKK